MSGTGQVAALMKSIDEYQNFRQMTEYNISCLMSYITPPTVGWRENVAAAIANNGVPNIIQTMRKHPNSLDMVRLATTSLSGLAISRENAGIVAHNGGIETALNCMLSMNGTGPDEMEVVDSGSKLLETVARFNPESIVQTPNAIISVLSGLNHSSIPRVQTASARVLDTVGKSAEGIAAIVNQDGIKHLISAMSPGRTTHEGMLMPTFNLLERLAKNPNHLQAIRAAGGVEALVAQLDAHSDNEDLLRAGGRLLAKLASEDIASIIQRLGMKNLNPATRQHLIGLLSNLALQPENVDKILKLGGLEAILGNFDSYNPQTKAAALRALQRIAQTGASSVQRIIDAGGLPIIINSLQEGINTNDENMMKAATGALSSIIDNGSAEVAQLVSQMGGTQAILGGLQTHPHFSGFSESGLDFLENLFSSGIDLMPLLDLGVIDSILLPMSHNPQDKEIQHKGLKALASLLSAQDENVAQKAAVALAGNQRLDAVVSALKDHSTDNGVVKEGVAVLAGLLKRNPQAKRKLADIGGIEALVEAIYTQLRLEMLGSSKLSHDANFTRNAATALSHLVDKGDVQGLSNQLAKASDPRIQTQLLKRVAVFALPAPFTEILAKEKAPSSLNTSLGKALSEAVEPNAVAIWSLAKSSLEAMGDLVDAGAMKSLLSASKQHTKEPAAVVACLKALCLFASSIDFKGKLQDMDAITTCVAAMRACADSPEVQVAAIELMTLLSSDEAGATNVCYKGGVRQVNKMIKDSSTTVEFEKATEKGMHLLYRVANVDKADVKDQLKKADTVNTVTVAMASYPSNDDIIEYGGRILALLMDEKDVADTIDQVREQTEALPSVPDKKLGRAFNSLGNKAATVGFLAMNPKNKDVMEKKQAPVVLNLALAASQKKPQAPPREGAVRNEYRAVGQLSSLVTPPKGTDEHMLRSLVAPHNQVSPLEKVGVLEGIRFMAKNPDLLAKLMNRDVSAGILDLITKNRANDQLVLAALDALSALMDTPEGVAAVTRNNGRDIISSILKDESENLGPKVTEAALNALTKLASDKNNAARLGEDGAIDAVTSALNHHTEESDGPQPAFVSSAARFLDALARGNEGNAEKIVLGGALKKLLDVVASSPEYFGNRDAMLALNDLLNTLTDSNVEDLLDKLNDMGAIDLIMTGINFNPNDEELQGVSQALLQKLIGGNTGALDSNLRDYDELLKQVVKRPNNGLGLERLNRAGINLGNLLLVPGVAANNGAQKIVKRALDTYEVVDKKVPDNVGPVKDQILETAVQTIGRSMLVPQASSQIDTNDALNKLVRALRNKNPRIQAAALQALGNLLADEQATASIEPKDWASLIDLVQTVNNKSSSPEVQKAAKQVLENIMDRVAKNPAILLAMGPKGDEALSSILSSLNDPKNLNDLLSKLVQSPGGPEALLRLALDPNTVPSLRKDILKGLADALDGLVTIPPNMLPHLLDRLNAKDVDDDEKMALLDLLGSAKIDPASADALLKKNTIESLLDLINDEHTSDPNMVNKALRALANLAQDPLVAKRMAALGAAERIIQGMQRFKDNTDIQEEGFNALTNLEDGVGGPENLNISPDALKYLDGALNGLNPRARERASKFINDLNELYNGEVEPMVISRFDNMLDALKAAKDWRELHDPKTGRPYYYNVVTKENTWQKPAVMLAAEQALNQLRQLADKAPAEIDHEKLRAAIGHFDEHASEPLRLKALAKALAALASNEKNRDAMVKHGVLDAIVKALNGKNVDREFILAAIALLNQFAKHRQFKLQICRLGGIRALIMIMKKYMEDDEIVEKAAQCLANLAFNSVECIAEIMKWEGPQVVGIALKTHKQTVPVLVNCMALVSNCMYKSEKNKETIGNLLRERIMIVLRSMYKDAAVLKQTCRALGNIAFIDDHVRYVCSHGAVKTIVAGMQRHYNNKGIVKLGIDVIGNFASVNNSAYEEQIRMGQMVSVTSTIWHEGGAKFIVDTFGTTKDASLVGSCIQSLIYLFEEPDICKKLVMMGVVPMILQAMEVYRNNDSVKAFCIESIEYLSYTFEGVKAIYESDGISVLLQQMESNTEDQELLEAVLKALTNMCSLRDVNKSLSRAIMDDIVKQGGIDIVINALSEGIRHPDFVIAGLKFLTLMTAMLTSNSKEIATKGMHTILKAINVHAKDVKVLESAFQLIGILAFQKDNLKIIVQYGGINLIVNSILAFPEEGRLVKRSIQTLDNIAMASQEHSNIVQQASGKKVIEELIKTYKTIPGRAAEDVVQACQAALLSLSKIETRAAKPRYIFTNNNGDDPNVDPLQNHRNLLRTGGIIALCNNNNGKPKQLFISSDWKSICISNPKSRNKPTEVLLLNVVAIKAGLDRGHGRKVDPELAFYIETTGKSVCLKAKDPQDRNRWVEALEALRKTFRNNKRWLN
eukprot:augustus_masked-scaffold_12-processed-gene-6.50-mRNA-1 protein AED:1.00 eAED:1.00 QI:0/-1/0/0/-1/1/1/0/2406